MKRIIVSLLLLVALFATAASVNGASTSTCVAKCLTNTVQTGARFTKKQVVQCIEDTCARPTVTKARTSTKRRDRMALKLNRVAQELLDKKPVVQEKEQVNEADTMSDSSITRGDVLTATTTLNIRAGPCTTHDKIGSMSAGQSKQFTGQVQSGCGYTWYSIDNGWVASDFVTVRSPVSSSQCTTRSYPLFKQCDAKWKNEALGTSTICSIGCLMSSVSMALNGLGKKINGETSNPSTLNKYLKNNGGYQGNLFVWGAVKSLGLNYQGKITSKSAIADNICANNVVILNVNNGGHWVLATGVSGDKSTFYVNDPGANKSSFSASEVSQAAVYTV